MNKSIIQNTPHGRIIITELDKPKGNYIIEIHKEVDSGKHLFEVNFMELTNINMQEFYKSMYELMNK